MRDRRMRDMRLLPFVLWLLSCTTSDADETGVPYKTTFSSAGDTILAATAGDVPEGLLRHLVVEWRLAADSLSPPLGDVSDIAVAADGQVWVWDGATPALWLLDANGSSIRRIGRVGSGPGEYRNVNGIAVARDGALVMWDNGNTRLTIYNSDGSYRTSSNVTFSDCCGLSVIVDAQNRVWLTAHPRMIGGKERKLDPAEFRRVQEIGYFRFDSAGALIDTLFAPSLPGADVLVSALHVTATSLGGASQWVPYGTYPRHEVSPLGHVVSVLTRPYAVHTEANGKHLRVTREFVPPPVAEEERAQQRANIEFRMRRVKSDFTWNGPEIPRTMPPINDLAVGLDGRIWVQLSVPSEAYEPERPAPTREPPPPPIKFRSKEKRWDVFEPDGRYLGRIVAPREVSLFVRRGNQVWGVVRDENDVPAIVRMRIDPAM